MDQSVGGGSKQIAEVPGRAGLTGSVQTQGPGRWGHCLLGRSGMLLRSSLCGEGGHRVGRGYLWQKLLELKEH